MLLYKTSTQYILLPKCFLRVGKQVKGLVEVTKIAEIN